MKAVGTGIQAVGTGIQALFPVPTAFTHCLHLWYNGCMSKKITILALSWRDIRAPKMGGAEVQTHEMLKRISKEKYNVIHFSPMFEGAMAEEDIDGVHYMRAGNAISVISYAKKYYKAHENKIDYVLDQCNTHRFFTKFWVPAEKRIFYIHQLTREIWDINLPFPFSKIGKIMETPMLRLNKNDFTVALSESTKQDLVDVGFDPDKIFIIPIGLPEEIYEYADSHNLSTNKKTITDKNNAFIYVGRYSPYKGMNVCIEALSEVKKTNPDMQLWLVGKKNDEFIENELKPLCDRLNLKLGDASDDNDILDVVMWGFVTEEEKYQLMEDAIALLFPSIREGWGIIVTEAAYVNTPSIVFDSPGARDAVNFGEAGYLCRENSVEEVARLMNSCISDTVRYKEVTEQANAFSHKFNWNENGVLFEKVIETIENRKNNAS